MEKTCLLQELMFCNFNIARSVLFVLKTIPPQEMGQWIPVLIIWWSTIQHG